MGVHELWDVVGPTARPVRLEALRNKRLAIDASIWIYQFLKAVRDKNGNPLKNAHIVGFFRRICKLLYFGIKPVFVFDGGVPVLKKQTIRKRKERRQDQKENVQKTAQRLLAKQLQHMAEVENEESRAMLSHKSTTRREVPIENLQFEEYYDDNNYLNDVHELKPKEQEYKKNEKESRFFGKQDDYDLPRLEKFNVDKNDERMVTDYEYDRLTQNIKDGLDSVNLDNIDPESPQFDKLPLSTQYIILSHLRLRSRLRMGYTKDQLEALFPNSMEFSKFQIQMVQKRNYYTQRLMNASGMDKDSFVDISRRVAGEKDREYKLKRTEGGYVMSITKENEDEGKTMEKPIKISDENFVEENEEDDQFEDEFVQDLDFAIDGSIKEVESSHCSQGSEYLTKKKSTKKENEQFDNDYNNDADEDTDDDSVQWEDLNLDKKETSLPIEMNKSGLPIASLLENKAQQHEAVTAFMDPSIHSNTTLFVDQTAEIHEKKESDPIMDKIKSLYEYAKGNNKDDVTMTVPSIIQQDAEQSQTEEELHQKEEDQLRQAIELSKKDYFNMQQREKSKITPDQIHTTDIDQPPIVLSKKILGKTLKLPKFNTGGSLLQRGTLPSPRKDVKTLKKVRKERNDDSLNDSEGVVIKNVNKDTTSTHSKTALSMLPDWFSRSEASLTPKERFKVDIGVNKKHLLGDKTEDEKAGLLKFSEVENLLPDIAKDDTSDLIILDDDNELAENNEIISISSEDHSVISGNFVSPGAQKSSNDQAQKKDTVVEATNDLTNPLPEVKPVKDELEDDYEFSEDEEEHLNKSLKQEEEAYGQFVNIVSHADNTKSINSSKWTMDEEIKLQEKLKKQKRDSDEVSTSMILDVQDLLSRFGIPFITAPMEAEAQCAELLNINLVDGIVTDDSDCFLFGGTIIYKNMFNEKNFVECYQLEDVSRDLGLTRKQMIDLALMLGSDYTSGLKGVGKVTAVEILSEFGDLVNFRDWWLEYQGGKIDKSKDNKLRRKIRKHMTKAGLFLGQDFPDSAVIEAYLNPEVDHDKTQFQWGHPNLDKLRTFLMFNVGWTQDKIDQILLPIVKSLNKPQTTIEEFFPAEMIRKRREIMMGKRLREATDKLKASYDKQQTKKRRTNF